MCFNFLVWFIFKAVMYYKRYIHFRLKESSSDYHFLVKKHDAPLEVENLVTNGQALIKQWCDYWAQKKP